MFRHVYVCMCVSVYMAMYYVDDTSMWMHICMYIQIHINVFEKICKYVYVYICICMCKYVYA